MVVALRAGQAASRSSPLCLQYLRQEHPVSGIRTLVPVRIPELRKVCLEFVDFRGRNLYAGKDAPMVGAVIAVMEQADVPVTANGVQEIQQGSGTFRKLETKQLFVLRHGAAADHVAHVHLRQLVVTQVLDLVAERGKVLDEPCPLRLPVPQLNAREDVRLGRIAVAIIELGDAAASDRLAELPETSRLLRYFDRQQHLPLFAHGGTFGNVAEAVEIDVGAPDNGYQRRVTQLLASYVFLDACERQ